MDDQLGNKPHSVTVESFSLDVNLVTVAEYTACVKAGKCSDKTSGGDYGIAGKDKHPINGVTWKMANGYCEWVGKRLPSAEEWEYAARGGEKATDFSWGNEEPTEKRLCYRKPARETCEVGSFPAGAFGLYDMNGQVWQWTSNNTGQYAIVKGNPASGMDTRDHYSANHMKAQAELSNHAYGFRCAK